jgi:hypothetical protein
MTIPFNTFAAGLPAASALAGTEIVIVEQSGVSSQTTPAAFKTYVGSGTPTYGSSVTDATPGTSANNYAPTGFSATTNRLLITAASGDTTFTGLVSTGFVDGQTVVIRNVSATDNLNFSHLSGSSSAANQFSCSQGLTQIIPPLSCAIIMYLTGISNWVFLS